MDLIVTIGGILYGLLLIAATFVRNRFTETIRIDALFLPTPTDVSRILNLAVGLLLVGYNVYSVLK
jgi:hypothetical protein